MPSRSIYTKLTRRHRTIGGYTQLWLASDHILLLNNSRIAEEYKRFALSDIQSIVVTRIAPPIVLQIVMIVASLAWMALWFTVDSTFGKWSFIVTGVLALLIPAIDIARGPRCRCYLHTRVTSERLSPVSRMRIAHKVLPILRPMIEAVQGTLPAITQPIAAGQPVAGPPPVLITKPGYLPEILFATFLLNAILIWSSHRFPKIEELPGILINTVFAEVLLIAVALVRRPGRDLRVIVYVLIALSIAGVGFDIATVAREVFGWYAGIIENAKNGDKSIPAFALFRSGNSKVVLAYSWRAAVGALGLAAAFFERRRFAKR